MPEPYGIETAGSFGVGNTYIIVSLGDTNWNQVAGTGTFAVPPELEDRVYKVGAVIEAVAAGTGTGTARRLNSQLGRIGGKLLADNLLRDGIDLAVKNTVYDDPVLYLKVDPEIKDTVSAGSFQLGIKYKIRTLGTTNFLLYGSLSNTIGTIFTATAPGAGTGTADRMTDSITDTDGADDQDPTPNQGAGSAIGFNTDSPAYDLDINNDAKTTNVEGTDLVTVSNIMIHAGGYLTTTVGPLYLSPSGHDPVIFHDKLATDNIFFTDNVIGSLNNASIEFNPSGSGNIELVSSVDISNDLIVEGSTTIDGNLTTPGSISFGDSTFTAPSTGDTLDFNTFIRQDLNPGIDNEFNLGSPTNKWGDVWAPDWTNAANLIPSRIRVSDQQILDGVAMEIRSLQSNDDLVLNPATGILYVEELKFDDPIPFSTIPIVIDNPNALSTSAGDEFGGSVELNRQVAASQTQFIVSAYKEKSPAGYVGSGYVYVYDITDGSLQFSIANPNPDGSGFGVDVDFFGYAIDISPSYIIAGAPRAQVGGVYTGQTYLFSTTDGSLLLTLNNPNVETTPSDDFFGDAVAVTESYAVVAASYENADPSNDGSGVVYVFDVTDGSLLYTLINPNYEGTTFNDRFGQTLAASDSYLIIAAPEDTVDTWPAGGVVYIYDITDGTLLYTIPNPESGGPINISGSRFGSSVDITDNYAIIGGMYPTGFGTAYIYDVSDGSLLHTISNPNAYSTPNNDRFGLSVAINDSLAIVGSPQEDDAGGNSSGKAYVFNVADGSLLYTLDNPNAYSTSAGDGFGRGVAMSTAGAIVTAPFEDDASGTSSGKAYLYAIGDGGSRITNLNATTPVQFASTGAGYLRFMGDNAVLIPAGDDASRPASPELGDTRWNTDQQYLECFDGTVYLKSTGGGEEITSELMEELGNVYSLILG